MRRKPNDPTTSILAETFRGAMEIVDRMRTDGATREDTDAYVANVLREAWPKGREEPWHFLGCTQCDNAGWVIKTCTNGSCGRPFKLPNQRMEDKTGQGRCQPGHTYAQACSCERGQEMRRQLMQQPRSIEDAVAIAARTTKPTRVGR